MTKETMSTVASTPSLAEASARLESVYLHIAQVTHYKCAQARRIYEKACFRWADRMAAGKIAASTPGINGERESKDIPWVEYQLELHNIMEDQRIARAEALKIFSEAQ